MSQPRLTPAQQRFEELTLELEALLSSGRPSLEILPAWRELHRQLLALEV